jgi:hypothetical protein
VGCEFKTGNRNVWGNRCEYWILDTGYLFENGNQRLKIKEGREQKAGSRKAGKD